MVPQTELAGSGAFEGSTGDEDTGGDTPADGSPPVSKLVPSCPPPDIAGEPYAATDIEGEEGPSVSGADVVSGDDDVPDGAAAAAAGGGSSGDDARDWGEQTDEEFAAWLATEFRRCVAYRTDPASAAVLEAAAVAVGRWRQRFREGGSREAWQRVMRNHRLVKELNEAAPVVARVLAVVSRLKLPLNGKATVLDLCSGFGYVSMLLSELLPPDRVGRIILCDRAWPLNNEPEPRAHHINWDHIYSVPGWPIGMSTSKRNLKATSAHRDLDKHLFKGSAAGCPVIVLGIHLCSTLSIRAVEVFNNQPTAACLMLKPCCLPNWNFVRDEVVWTLGSHSFPAIDVCARGKWNKKGWSGPDRSGFKSRFDAWAGHLFCGIEPAEGGSCAKCRAEIKVQESHYQNSFLFAERSDLLTEDVDGAGVEATAAGLRTRLGLRVSVN